MLTEGTQPLTYDGRPEWVHGLYLRHGHARVELGSSWPYLDHTPAQDWVVSFHYQRGRSAQVLLAIGCITGASRTGKGNILRRRSRCQDCRYRLWRKRERRFAISRDGDYLRLTGFGIRMGARGCPPSLVVADSILIDNPE
jgi:hypothetical protein